MTVVFHLGRRLRVACIQQNTLENGVLHNVQQSGRAVNSFIDQGEFFNICIYNKKSQLNILVWGSLTLAPINKLIHRPEEGLDLKSECVVVSEMVHLPQE